MKPRRVGFILFLLLLLTVNIYIIIHRNEGYKYQPYKSYSELYVMDSAFYLKDLHFTNDSLQLVFSVSLPYKPYHLTIDNDFFIDKLYPRDNQFMLPLKAGLHTYKLYPTDNNSFPVIIKAEHPVSNELHPDYLNEFLYCNLPGPGINTTPVKLWQRGINDFSNEERQYGINLLRSKTNIATAGTDFAKAREIIKFVASLPNYPQGTWPPKLFFANGCIQIQTALKQQVPLNCGNYSKIIYYLCSILGIPNRVVNYFGPNGNWSYGVHYLNEIYLREQQQWAFLDGTLNANLLHDSLRFYHLVDLKKMVQTNGLTGKYIYSANNDSVVKVAADSVINNLQYFNQSNADMVFDYPGINKKGNLLNLVFNFYSFNNDVAFYSDINRNYWDKIMVKMISFYGFVLLAIVWIMAELRYKRKRRIVRRNI